LRWVAREPTFTFRAVAAAKDDPLRDPYRDVLGAFGSNVRASYLEQRGDDWYVWPALTPTKMGWPEKNAYLKVKAHRIQSKDIRGYTHFNSSNYRPGWYDVTFDLEFRQGKRGRFVSISQIGSRDASYEYRGTLVCSGNMLETGQTGQKSPRKNHALLLLPDGKARPLKIRSQSVQGNCSRSSLAGSIPRIG